MQAYGRDCGRVGASAADASFFPISFLPFSLENCRCLISALLRSLPTFSTVKGSEAGQRRAIKDSAEGGGEGGRDGGG